MKPYLSTGAKILTLALTATLFSACGMSPLTEEQKAKFFSTIGDTNRTVQAGQSDARGNTRNLRDQEGNGIMQTLLSPLGSHSFVLPQGSDDQPTGAADIQARKENEKRYQTLSKVLSDSDCTRSFDDKIFNNGSVQLENPEYRVTLSGTNCPISLKMAVSGSYNHSSQSVEAKIEINYKVTASQLEELVDITSFNTNGNFTMSASDSAGSMTMALEGDLDSKSDGKVTFNSALNANGSEGGYEGEFSVTLGYESFTAQIKSTMSSQEGTKYYLNDKEVSPEELSRLLKNEGVDLTLNNGSGTITP